MCQANGEHQRPTVLTTFLTPPIGTEHRGQPVATCRTKPSPGLSLQRACQWMIPMWSVSRTNMLCRPDHSEGRSACRIRRPDLSTSSKSGSPFCDPFTRVGHSSLGSGMLSRSRSAATCCSRAVSRCSSVACDIRGSSLARGRACARSKGVLARTGPARSPGDQAAVGRAGSRYGTSLSPSRPAAPAVSPLDRRARPLVLRRGSGRLRHQDDRATLPSCCVSLSLHFTAVR